MSILKRKSNIIISVATIIAAACLMVSFFVVRSNNSQKARAMNDTEYNQVVNESLAATGQDITKTPNDNNDSKSVSQKTAIQKFQTPQAGIAENPQVTQPFQLGSSDTSDTSVSLNPQNTWQPEFNSLIGRTVYDTNCSGVTGICIKAFSTRTIEVYNEKGTLTTTTVSDENGYFTLKLSVGTYTLIPGLGSGVNPSAASQQVTIVEGSTNNIVFNYWAIATTNLVTP